MEQIGLFFGSSTGCTEDAALLIKEEIDALQPDLIVLHNLAEDDLSSMPSYAKLMLGVSTWEEGGLQEDWFRVFPDLDGIDLSGKQVALFGFGDQAGFPSTFQNGLGVLARKVRERGGTLVGLWPTAGYTFQKSLAVEGNTFLGLSLDNDAQMELTDDRIRQWLQQVMAEFGIS